MLSQDEYLDALDALDALDVAERRYSGLAKIPTGDVDADAMFAFACQSVITERTHLETAVRAFQRRHPKAPTTRNP